MKNHIVIFFLFYLSFFAGISFANEISNGFSYKIETNESSGGGGTIINQSREAFAKPLSSLQTQKLRDFTFGNKIFNTRWVTAPASVTSLDGLGPNFNRVSCASCHFKDGRGRPPLNTEEPMTSMLIRLSVEGKDNHGGVIPHPLYGGQLNDQAINNVPIEGRAIIKYSEIKGQYLDGSSYTLRKPTYEFKNLSLGPIGEKTLFSPRVAPAVIGMGLLEAIPEQTLLALSDPEDKNGDGISGRPNMVWDAVKQKVSIGRFGWKANVASILEQDAAAANGDIGITTSFFKEQNCTSVQKSCLNATNGGIPEMSDEQLHKLTFYIQTLAVPARRNVEEPVILKGASLFEKAQCSLCHIPQIETGSHELNELTLQKIQPFSDLLLHDMGPELSDNREDFEAKGMEWRTAPLWGIGLVETVNKHTYFLHDGRARSLEEAILWHSGEAESAKEKFRSMKKEDRDSLIEFLKSL